MRTAILLAVVLSAGLLAGCATKKSQCPDEYGPEFDKAYHAALDMVKEQGLEIPPDSDGDCINDFAEQALGTDPNNYASHPTLEQLQGLAGGNPGISDPPETPAAPPLAWEEERYSGQFITNTAFDAESATSPRNFLVPDGATMAWLNITVKGQLPGDVNVRFLPPGCGDAGCWKEEPATGGSLQVLIEEPDAGQWSIVLFAGMGFQQGSFDLGVNALLPVAASTTA